MTRIAPLLLLLVFLVGCASNEKAPLLTRRAQLQFNTGQTVRIVGAARYSKVTGPSIIGEDFEIRAYPTTVWAADAIGQRVEVTGMLHEAAQSTPPDPSVLPGEYWIEDTKWIPAESPARAK